MTQVTTFGLGRTNMLWDLLYRASYELALTGCDDHRAVRLLLDLGGEDRSGFEAARLHYLGHLAGGVVDRAAEVAKRYLEAALRSGDDGRRWRLSDESVDPWDFARHRRGPVPVVA